MRYKFCLCRFKHEVYKQLGKTEAEDTIAVARYNML